MNGYRVLALALLLGATGCNDVPGRRQFLPIPSPVTTPAGSLVVDGPTAIEPGGSARFTATFVGDDGARRDVTREAHWSLSGFGISMAEPGVATAQDLGFVRIFVSYGPAYTARELSARPPGTFVVKGRVSPLVAVVAAQVEVLEGATAGQSKATDGLGNYVFVGLAGPTRLRASLLGHVAEERTLAVDRDLDVDFELAARSARDPQGRWLLVVHVRPDCGFRFSEVSEPIELVKDSVPWSTSYLVTLPSRPAAAPLRAMVQSSVLRAELFWGDPFWDEGIGVPLGETAEIAGIALGEIADTRISGTINGAFQDGRTAPYTTCYGDHAFEMRRQ